MKVVTFIQQVNLSLKLDLCYYYNVCLIFLKKNDIQKLF